MTMGLIASLGRVAVVTCLLALVVTGLPRTTLAAVGDGLLSITPQAVSPFVSPSCGTQGGTSLAIVQGTKLAGVNAGEVPVALVVTCLDNNDVNARARLNFLDPANGQVVAQFSTKIGGVIATPSATPRGWAHVVNQPDKGKLLGCGSDGSLYGIDYSQFTTTPDGTATLLQRPAALTSCAALAWDPEEDLIYQGVIGNNATVGIYRFAENATTTTPFGNLAFVNTPGCTPAGVAITGGVLVVACQGKSTILRVDKNTGLQLGTYGQLGVLGLAAGQNLNPSLGDLACDPVSFGAQYKDAMWSRNGTNGNGAVALRFPPYTCGLPKNATVLWAGLSAPSGGQAGVAPLAACFANLVNPVPNGNGFDGDVIDSDQDGLPDCWENGALWSDGKPGIDFEGNGSRDLALCVSVDTNGDGVDDTLECAGPNRKDLFVEIDWMAGFKPNPAAMSQTLPVVTVGIQSVREAFAWAPVDPIAGPMPGAFKGIALHFQVDEQVSFFTLDPNSTTKVNTVTELVFTPCTPPAFTVNANGTVTQNPKSLADAADFDTIKRDNFGTASDRAAGATLNAKRLAFRYVLFANKQVGLNQGGASNSGCAEVGGDDAAITLGAFPTATATDVAGTLMHELGHTLGLRHGSHDDVNCKPNLRSVMSYTRQLTNPLGPIPNRRLDYSRAQDLDLNEASLNEGAGIGSDSTLGPIIQLDPALFQQVTLFSTPDQIAYAGLNGAWSVVPAAGIACPIGTHCINWDQSKFTSGQSKGLVSYNNLATANLNAGSGGCPGDGTTLEGNNDWATLQYRASAALEFAGGVGHGDPEQDITVEQAVDLGLAADLDGNGVADSTDCGTYLDESPFSCTHRIDIKPGFALPKVINLGAESNITIAIFSETGVSADWDATTLVDRTSLKFRVGSVEMSVKLNSKGQGTCSVSDVADPETGIKDGPKDLKCQFPTSGLPGGEYIGVVTGTFTDQVFKDPVTHLPLPRKFLATQPVTILP
jgi:hypothetical protein